jgi:hypothetical protein
MQSVFSAKGAAFIISSPRYVFSANGAASLGAWGKYLFSVTFPENGLAYPNCVSSRGWR